MVPAKSAFLPSSSPAFVRSSLSLSPLSATLTSPPTLSPLSAILTKNTPGGYPDPAVLFHALRYYQRPNSPTFTRIVVERALLLNPFLLQHTNPRSSKSFIRHSYEPPLANSFVCHSYEKRPGDGGTLQTSNLHLPTSSYSLTALLQRETMDWKARATPQPRVSSEYCKESFSQGVLPEVAQCAAQK
jgi:hypothetical protein